LRAETRRGTACDATMYVIVLFEYVRENDMETCYCVFVYVVSLYFPHGSAFHACLYGNVCVSLDVYENGSVCVEGKYGM
jgi:hypothetical protein